MMICVQRERLLKHKKVKTKKNVFVHLLTKITGRRYHHFYSIGTENYIYTQFEKYSFQ